MTAKLIKGTEIREEILEEITADVAEIKEKHGVVPGLVTILVGENPGVDLLRYPEDQNRPSRRVSMRCRTPSPDDISGRRSSGPHRQVQQ
jgi:5,10-methylene-tetrahydrofolate dehydrogenase/methenyl tetrahydrofolate cyclohydrolase